MPLFDIVLTVSTFKTLADGSQMKAEKLLSRQNSVLAASPNTALILAGRALPADLDADELANATVLVKAI